MKPQYDNFCLAAVTYLTTTVLITLGVSIGHNLVIPSYTLSDSNGDLSFVERFANWDGAWYLHIMRDGYSYDPWRMSPVAFFPAYPIIARFFGRFTGIQPEWALLVVSHAALFGSFLIMANYVQKRYGDSSVVLRGLTLLSFGVFPITFWMRMSYSESLFLLALLLAMFGMEQDWRPSIVAAVIGFATATRPAGVALLPVFWLWLLRRPHSMRRQFVGALLMLPLTLWGLLAYMVFLQVSFGDPLAFVHTQIHWNERDIGGVADQLVQLITLEPFWAVYVPSSDCFWGRVRPYDYPLFNLRFWNPIFVVLTIGLVAVGGWKRWLNTRELLLAAGLLAIPIWFQAGRACMMSQARYASVVFPMYMVLAQVLGHLPPTLVSLLTALCAVFLCMYTAMFVSGYWFY